MVCQVLLYISIMQLVLKSHNKLFTYCTLWVFLQQHIVVTSFCRTLANFHNFPDSFSTFVRSALNTPSFGNPPNLITSFPVNIFLEMTFSLHNILTGSSSFLSLSECLCNIWHAGLETFLSTSIYLEKRFSSY